MKNLLLLCITALCLYLYFNPEAAQEEKPVPVVAAPVATAPKYYYHSPLEAPAMPTGVSTGGGYYSADPTTRFSNYQHHSAVGGGGQVAGGSTIYSGGGSTYSSTTVSGGATRGTTSYNSANSGMSYMGGRTSNSIRSSDLRRDSN